MTAAVETSVVAGGIELRRGVLVRVKRSGKVYQCVRAHPASTPAEIEAIKAEGRHAWYARDYVAFIEMRDGKAYGPVRFLKAGAYELAAEVSS